VSAEGLPPLDPKRAKAFSDETRVRVLRYLSSHPLTSAPELSKKLRIPEDRLNYHLGVLLGCDCIEVAATRERHGKDTRLFSVKSGAIFSIDFFGSLAESEQEPINRSTFKTFASKVHSLLGGEPTDGDESATIALETLDLTDEHRHLAKETIRLTVIHLRQLGEMSRQVNIATAAPLEPVEFGIALLQTLQPDSEDQGAE
jgi:DNA-binding transcriptional ArsR family regulator